VRLVRTEYWNPSTGTVRTGSTGHGESLADVETYLQTPSVGAVAGPSLQSRQDGGLDIVLPGSQAAVLSVEGSAGILLARGNVGIGTGTDPLAKALHVTGSVHSGGAGLTLPAGGTIQSEGRPVKRGREMAGVGSSGREDR
jgi:hypothetical protein